MRHSDPGTPPSYISPTLEYTFPELGTLSDVRVTETLLQRRSAINRTDVWIDIEPILDVSIREEAENPPRQLSGRVFSPNAHETGVRVPDLQEAERLRDMLRRSRAECARLSRLFRERSEQAKTLEKELETERAARSATEAELNRKNALLDQFLALNDRDTGRRGALFNFVSIGWDNNPSIAFAEAAPRLHVPLDLSADLQQAIEYLKDGLRVIKGRLAAPGEQHSTVQWPSMVCMNKPAKAHGVERQLKNDVETRIRRLLGKLSSSAATETSLSGDKCPTSGRREGLKGLPTIQQVISGDMQQTGDLTMITSDFGQLQRRLEKLTQDFESYKRRQKRRPCDLRHRTSIHQVGFHQLLSLIFF
jgi:hypothetical protein